MQLQVEVGADHGETALREVQHTRAAVDKYDALAQQRIDRTEADSEQGVLNQVRHGSSLKISPPGLLWTAECRECAFGADPLLSASAPIDWSRCYGTSEITLTGWTLGTFSNACFAGFHSFKNIVGLKIREYFGFGLGLAKSTGGINAPLPVPNVTVV